MILQEEIEKQIKNLNEYQKKFIETTKDLFSIIPSEKIRSTSFVNFNTKSKILEIYIEHIDMPDIPLLFIIHGDMIEISCSEFEYYMDSIGKALFNGLQKEEFYSNVKDFVNSTLRGKFNINLYSYKGKIVKSEIVWNDNIYPSYQRSYILLSFLSKKRVLKKEEINIKSFIE
ncbi:MAG: hypothetical protein WCX31_22375 [Salinivirgaceae bacterium]|jgi:hypothetical protein